MANRRKSQGCPLGCGRFHRNEWGFCRVCLQAAGIEVRPDGTIPGYGSSKSAELRQAFVKLNERRRKGEPLLVPPMPAPSLKRESCDKKRIPCLRCGHIFNSAGAGNRICQCCKGGLDWRDGNIGDWNVGGLGGYTRFPSRSLPTSVR
jgi:hypothetical protein